MASRACPLKSGDGLLKTELTTDVEHAVTRLKELGKCFIYFSAQTLYLLNIAYSGYWLACIV